MSGQAHGRRKKADLWMVRGLRRRSSFDLQGHVVCGQGTASPAPIGRQANVLIVMNTKGGQQRWTVVSDASASLQSRDSPERQAGCGKEASAGFLNIPHVYGQSAPSPTDLLSTFIAAQSQHHGLNLELRSNIPEQDLYWLQQRLSRTMPVLSNLFPAENPCLRWTGALDKDGYARHRVPIALQGRGLSNVVSRFVYQLAYGDIPATRTAAGDDWTVDHVCGLRPCINPTHLRLLPRGYNAALGDF